MNMQVQALIQAAGAGVRLGLGPKAFVRLDGSTLLERAIATVSGLVSDVIVAVPETLIAPARALVEGARVTVIAGGCSRSETTRLLVEAARAPWLLLHDVVHPFVTADLVAALLAAAQEHGAAAPGITNTEFLYSPDGDLLHAPGDVLVGQKPVAFARQPVADLYARRPAAPASADPSFLELLRLAGTPARFVPGAGGNIKVTCPDDLRFAEALLALGRRAS
ncbi:2-C-methyl-D-erythritol 4-phosphate cytidylyltransferase [Allostella sp. ATCC 35155]|nr:2-C-methyl-D-erythritol 4-phosphate cytidylyltransferase [Stella sp. ATCC 35155]